MFKLGNHMAFGVSDMHEAANFYSTVLGFRVLKQGDDYVELDAGDFRLYIVQDNVRQPTFELMTPDVDTAVEFLEHHGCLIDEDMTEDSGQPVVRDPYGYLWLINR